MIQFVSITVFRQALDALLKVKRRPLQQLDIPDEELKKLVRIFTTEARAREVVIHDINDNLKQIIPQ